MRPVLSWTIPPLVAAALAGCAVGPDYVAPTIASPGRFMGEAAVAARRAAPAPPWRAGRGSRAQLKRRVSAGMRTLRYVVADVFTDTPLEGNQLAVFTDARDLDDLTMQDLARELNLSETVFRRCAVPTHPR